MSLKPRNLRPNVEYRIDGLGSDLHWHLSEVADGHVVFHGPRRELARLPIERLYQVRPGVLHYVSD